MSSPVAHKGEHARDGEVPTEAANRVLVALGHDPGSADLLAERTGLAADVVAAALVELELLGRVALLPGGVYQRTR